MNTKGAEALDGLSIGIVAMTSWGEAGNWLSAKSLETTIRRAVPNATVLVHAAEELVPRFAEVGQAIKVATLNSSGREDRGERYAAVLDTLASRFPPGSEDDVSGAFAAEVARAVEWVSATKPDLLIGTKGIICRALHAATRLAGIPVPIVNYVTNHGHFAFEIHRCAGANVHLVRLSEAERFLVAECGFDPAKVRFVGYLVAAQSILHSEPASVKSALRASLIVVSNRGGAEYLKMLRRLAADARDVDLTFVALHDESLHDDAQEIAAAANVASWQVLTHLDQPRLFGLMRQVRESPICALVCKASPNSIFEAAYFRLPMFLLRTGLPMEDWGADLVLKEGLGVVADDMDILTTELLTHLRSPSRLAHIRARLDDFAQRQVDQEQSTKRVVEALVDAVTSRD